MEYATKVYLSKEKISECETDDKILEIKDKIIKSLCKELIEQNIKYKIKEDENGFEIEGILTLNYQF